MRSLIPSEHLLNEGWWQPHTLPPSTLRSLQWVTRCPPRVVGAASPLRWVCGAWLLPALLALTHFPAVFLRSDRGPSRTSVTSQPTGFSISYCFDWKNVFSTSMQARTNMALHLNVCKTHKSQEERELEQQQKNPVLICRLFLQSRYRAVRAAEWISIRWILLTARKKPRSSLLAKALLKGLGLFLSGWFEHSYYPESTLPFDFNPKKY